MIVGPEFDDSRLAQHSIEQRVELEEPFVVPLVSSAVQILLRDHYFVSYRVLLHPVPEINPILRHAAYHHYSVPFSGSRMYHPSLGVRNFFVQSQTMMFYVLLLCFHTVGEILGHIRVELLRLHFGGKLEESMAQLNRSIYDL